MTPIPSVVVVSLRRHRGAASELGDRGTARRNLPPRLEKPFAGTGLAQPDPDRRLAPSKRRRREARQPGSRHHRVLADWRFVMRARNSWGVGVIALASLTAAVGVARANHIGGGGFTDESSGAVVIQPSPPVVVEPSPSVVVQPAPSTVVVPGQTIVVPGQTIQAEDLEANEVRAQTIYANKIRAPEVRGAIHQTGRVKIQGSASDLKAPVVTASVVYADTIKAHRVIADNIFVRDLERR